MGGGFNLSRACVDRWADEDPERIALRSEKETGETRELSFGGLRDVVSRRRRLDRARRLPWRCRGRLSCPWARRPWCLRAVSRIGAIFIPVFSGYGAEAVATRLEDPRPRVMICADGFQRRGRPIEMKEVADQAIEQAGGVEKVIVVDYAGRADTPMIEGRDLVARIGVERRARRPELDRQRGPW